jgi:hypothetical protein
VGSALLASRLTRRIAGFFGVVAPPLGMVLVLVAGATTPGYDPANRTVSRLAVPGMPEAWMVEVAIGLIAVSCYALAFAQGGSPIARWAMLVAGAALIGAAIVRLDPGSTTSTAAHRIATGVAILGLTIAALAAARSYDRVSFGIGLAELAALLLGLALLPTSFSAWGLWERCLLLLPLAWIVVMSARVLVHSERKIVSADEMISASVESLSSTGS